MARGRFLLITEGVLIKKQHALELLTLLLLLFYQDAITHGMLVFHVAYHRGELVREEREKLSKLLDCEAVLEAFRLARDLLHGEALWETAASIDTDLLEMLIDMQLIFSRVVQPASNLRRLCTLLSRYTRIARYDCNEDAEIHSSMLKELRENLPPVYVDAVVNDWGKWLLHALLDECKRGEVYNKVVVISHDARLVESIRHASATLLPTLLAKYDCTSLSRASFHAIHVKTSSGPVELFLSLCRGLIRGCECLQSL